MPDTAAVPTAAGEVAAEGGMDVDGPSAAAAQGQPEGGDGGPGLDAGGGLPAAM